MKRCSKCRESKPESAFYKDKSCASGFRSLCAACSVKSKKESRLLLRESENARRRARYAESAEHRRVRRGYRLKHDYGLTLQDYDRMFAEQRGGCAICGRAANVERFGVLAVDHDHVTGAVRGLLCAFCNALLGRVRDSAEHLAAAAAYLRRSTT